MPAYRILSAVALAVTVVLSVPGPAAADSVHPGTYSGPGFDACTAPDSTKMKAWAASPYRAVGVYIGGSNRGCKQPALTAAWVAEQTRAGWHLIPFYVGRQAACTTSTSPNRIDNSKAVAQGRADADDAAAQARALGLARDSTLIFDMEAYDGSDPACTAGVVAFLSAWSARVHDNGYLAGFYSSMGSGVRDLVAAYNNPDFVRPDYVHFARWDTVSTLDDPGLPAGYWAPDRRIKQYRGGHSETWGGVAINVDNNVLGVKPIPRTPSGDFDGNGWPDVITRSGGTLLLNTGNGHTLNGAATIGTGWQGLDPIIRIGDLNSDGREDLIARHPSNGNLVFYPGTGSGTGTSKVLGTGWQNLRELTPVGDFNKDGYPDLLAAGPDNALYLYPGRSGATFGTRIKVGSSGWETMSELARAGDFDRNGTADLIARHTATGDLYLYPGNAGGFGGRRLLATGWSGMRDLVGPGDFNRDGWTDLIAIGADGVAYRWEGTGSGLGRQVAIAPGFGARSPAL